MDLGEINNLNNLESFLMERVLFYWIGNTLNVLSSFSIYGKLSCLCYKGSNFYSVLLLFKCIKIRCNKLSQERVFGEKIRTLNF